MDVSRMACQRIVKTKAMDKTACQKHTKTADRTMAFLKVSTHPILQLQQFIGNQAVQRLAKSYPIIQRQVAEKKKESEPKLQAPYFIDITNVTPPKLPDHSVENPGPSKKGIDRAGYTLVRVKPRMTIDWDNLPPIIAGKVQLVPLYIRSANIFFCLDLIEVYVSSRYAVDSCPYRITWDHESQHVSAFLHIFHGHKKTMISRANEIHLPTETSPVNVPKANIDAEQERITAPVAQAIREVRELIKKEMEADRKAKDAPASYAKIYDKCPSSEW